MFRNISNKFQNTWKAKEEYIKDGTFDPTNPKHWNIPEKENSMEQLDLEEQVAKIINKYIKSWPNGKFSVQHLDKLYDYLIFIHKTGRKDIFKQEDEVMNDLFFISPN